MSTQETKLKAIADAIREKDGTTAPIPANDFPERIRAIETGGLPEGLHTITVQADPPEGGAVTGGGMASAGMQVTVSAKPVEGSYLFSGWQLNGEGVGTDEDYSFSVENDQTLIAKFSNQSSLLPAGTKLLEYIYQESLHARNYIILPAISIANSFELKYGLLPYNTQYNKVTALCGSLTFSSGTLSSISGITIGMPDSTYGSRSFSIYARGKTFAANVDQDVPSGPHYLTLNYAEKIINIDGEVTNKSPGSWFKNELYFFAPKISGAGGGAASHVSVYSIVWKDANGEVIRHLVPCQREDGTVCMYDIIASVFYTDQSTAGDGFVAGPEV